MTNAEQPVTRRDDPILGELSWHECAWIGAVDFGSHPVRLVIDPDEEFHTHEQRVESIEYAKALLAKVRESEARLRRQGVEEIAEAAGSQAAEDDKDRYLAEVARAAESMVPQTLCIVFPDGGHLEYRDASAQFYGTSTVVIRFDSDGEYEEVELDFADHE